MSAFRWARPVAVAVLALAVFGCASSEANGDGAGSSGGGEVVAKIGDDVITAAELEAEVRAADSKAWQAWYDARKRALDTMITKRVLDAEVARRGTTAAGLQAEITKDVTPATEAEVQAFYNQNQARMGGRTFEQMKPQIEQHLASLRGGDIMSDFMTDLKKKAGAHILLEPPRSEVKIAANDPRKGPAGAPITLVEYSDFQ